MTCEICEFENPKVTVTGIILRDNQLLLLKRNEEPFKGQWDLPGGFMNKGEAVEEAMKREMKEELGVQTQVTFIRSFPGTAYWKDKGLRILSKVFLVDIGSQKIKLNEENSELKWIPLKDLDFSRVAFDSNQEACSYIQQKFTFDLDRVRELIRQLDPEAEVKEQSLYRAIIGGHLETVEEDGKLIGMGWIFPRQTLLRKQAVVEDMIVDEPYRGRGLGEKILRNLLIWAKFNGVEVVELTTHPSRVRANELYQEVGFKLHPTNHYLLKI